MDFNLQDPTERGPLFSYLSSFVAAEQAYINKRKQFFDAIGFTFPSFLENVVNEPSTSPVTHITDALPAGVANVVPASVQHAIDQSPVMPSSLWQRFRGKHGG